MSASKIREAIDQLAKATDHEDWRHPALIEYLQLGDEAVLAQVPNFQNQWPWAWQISAVLPDPEQWTEEAARMFRIAKLKDSVMVRQWLEHRQADVNDGNAVGLGPALERVRAAGYTAAEIRKMVIVLSTWDGQRPTPLGLLLLDGSDDEVKEWLDSFGYFLPSDGRSWMLSVLAAAQPERLFRLLDQPHDSSMGDQDKVYGSAGYEVMVRANPTAFADRACRYAASLPKENARRFELMIAVAEASPSSALENTLDEACRMLEGANSADSFDQMEFVAASFLVRQKHMRAKELCCHWINRLAGDKGDWCLGRRQRLWEEVRTQHPDWQPSFIKAAVTSKLAKLVAAGLGWWRECWLEEDATKRTEALQMLAEGKQDGGQVDEPNEPKVLALARLTALIWMLMQHKSKEVRKVAARALADLGANFVSQKAHELQQHKKAEVREAAADLLGILSAPPDAAVETESSPGASRRAKLLQGRAIENPQSLAYPFLEDMYADGYFPARLVDKVTKILLRLCEQIELQRPADLDALYKLTHAATEKINLLQDQFEDAGSEIETVAREIMGDNFCFIASAYGFENADREELIATRDW
jgi:hypothetical protein